MDPRIFLMIFFSVFVAELGDKTQLATMLFAADKEVNKWLVFAAASAALVVSTALGVLAGNVITNFVTERQLSLVAGSGFILIGLFTILRS